MTADKNKFRPFLPWRATTKTKQGISAIITAGAREKKIIHHKIDNIKQRAVVMEGYFVHSN